MGKPPLPQKGFRALDWRVGANVTLSVIVYMLITTLIPEASRYINLCILGICCAFLADSSWQATWKNGLVRIGITSIGAVMALIPLLAYDLTQSETVLTIVFGLGAVCALVLGKYLNIMYVQVRLSLVAYILTVYTFHESFYAAQGNTGYLFCAMWILSTLLGAVISVVVAYVADAMEKGAKKKSICILANTIK